MSEKRTKMRQRSLAFRRRLRGEKKNRAVSPVVATLILILIAVAAAAALYLWLVAWQGGVTKGIGSPTAQYTVTIGGSTSVYPFAEQAATWFEQNNSDVVISVNQGGSGAGAAAVCTGQVDIGEMSSYSYTAAYLEANDGCPATLNQQIIAYDGVDVIVAANNPHFVTAQDAGSGNTPNSVQWDTMEAIYEDISSTAPTQSGINTPTTFTMDGFAGVAQPAQGTGFVWDQIPAFAAADLGNTYGGQAFAEDSYSTTVTSAGAVATHETPCTAPYAHDLCDPDPTTEATSCGFSICLGGTGDVATTGGYLAPIDVNYRSDVSGTTQGFTARVMAVGATSNNPLDVGFTGCGSDGQFGSCGFTYSTHTTGGAGNPIVIQNVGGQEDGIGYASDGLVQVSSVVVPVNLQGYGQTVIVNMQGASTALAAIALGINDVDGGKSSYATDQAYIGWRPFINTETNTPTGEVLRYLEFVMDPGNNIAIATATAEISVYAQGLAGHVPVTPLTGYQIPSSF